MGRAEPSWGLRCQGCVQCLVMDSDGADTIGRNVRAHSSMRVGGVAVKL